MHAHFYRWNRMIVADTKRLIIHNEFVFCFCFLHCAQYTMWYAVVKFRKKWKKMAKKQRCNNKSSRSVKWTVAFYINYVSTYCILCNITIEWNHILESHLVWVLTMDDYYTLAQHKRYFCVCFGGMQAAVSLHEHRFFKSDFLLF